LAFSSGEYAVLENADSLSLTVNRIDGSSGSVSVDYVTRDGTATAGSDYQTTLGTLTFADGVTSQSFAVPLIDDADPEIHEDFSVSLSNPTGGATLGSPSDALVTLLDDESTPRYDFENLPEGDIDGRDNWFVVVDADQAYATVITDGTTVNGTRVVRPNSGLNGMAGQIEMTRVNNANFGFAPFTGGAAEIWFDATGDDNAIFALGQDRNGDGQLLPADDEIGVPFGIWERQFAILTGNSLTVRAGVADLGTDNLPTDWYRMRLRIDFATNGGEGSGSLDAMNLSRGETSFTEVPTLQDVDLKLLFNGAPDPSTWQAMFLLLRIDASNIPKADNLMPNVPTSTVP
jgi:hypothetical protein